LVEKLHAEIENLPDLGVEHFLGQAVLRDAVAEHAARLGLRLEHVHGVTAHGQVVRAREAARAGAHDGHALAVARRHLGPVRLCHAQIEIRDEALDVVDAHRLIEQVAPAALDLARPRAHPAADGGQGVLLLDETDGLAELPQGRERDVALDVDAGRAFLLARADAVGVVVRH